MKATITILLIAFLSSMAYAGFGYKIEDGGPLAVAASGDNGYVGQTTVSEVAAYAGSTGIQYGEYTATSSGTAQYFHVYTEYLSADEYTTEIGVFSEDGTLLGKVTVTDAASTGWHHYTLAAPIEIAAATVYLLGVTSADGNWRIYGTTDDAACSAAMTPGSMATFTPSCALATLGITLNNLATTP